MDNANAKVGCSEGDGVEMHLVKYWCSASVENCMDGMRMLDIAGFIVDLYIGVIERSFTITTRTQGIVDQLIIEQDSRYSDNADT